MTHQDLHKLTSALEALHHNETQDRQHQRRIAAGKKPHALQSGRPPQIAFPDRVLATVLHLRLSLPEDTLAPMFTSNRTTIRRAIHETRQLLDHHGTTIEPITPSAALIDLLLAASTAAKQPHITTKIKPTR